MAAGGAVTLPAVHDTGSGPAVLFLHAFPLDSSMWDHQVAAISGSFRCLRVDMWGCGSSPAPPDEPGFASYVRAALTAMDERGIESFGLVACSMGSYVAWEVLRAAPERVISLVLVGSRSTADTEDGRKARADMIASIERDGVDAILEDYVTRLVAPKSGEEAHITDPIRARIRRWSVDGLVWALRSISDRPDSTALLADIRVPTLVIAGELDAFMPVGDQEQIAQRIPGARFVRFDGYGHLPNLEAHPTFSDALAEHLNARPTGG